MASTQQGLSTAAVVRRRKGGRGGVEPAGFATTYEEGGCVAMTDEMYRDIIAKQVDLINSLKMKISSGGSVTGTGGGGSLATKLSNQISELKRQLATEGNARRRLEASLAEERSSATETENTLATRLRDLEEQLSLATVARSQVAAEYAAAKREAGEATSARDALCEEIDALRGSVDEWRRAHARVQADLETAQSRARFDRDEAWGKLQSAEAEASAARAERDDFQAAASNASALLDKANIEYAEKQAELTKDVEEANGRIASLVDSHSAEMEVCAAARRELEVQLASARAETSNAHGKAYATSSELVQRASIAESEATQLKVRVGELEGELMCLRSSLLRAEDALVAERAQYEKDVVQEKNFESGKGDIYEEQARANSEAAMVQLKNMADSMDDAIAEKESALNELSEARRLWAQAEESAAVLRAELSELRSKHETDAAAAAERAHELVLEADRARAAARQAGIEKGAAESDVAPLKARVASLEQQLKTESARIKQLQEKNSSFTASSNRQQREMDELRGQLDTVTTRLRAAQNGAQAREEQLRARTAEAEEEAGRLRADLEAGQEQYYALARRARELEMALDAALGEGVMGGGLEGGADGAALPPATFERSNGSTAMASRERGSGGATAHPSVSPPPPPVAASTVDGARSRTSQRYSSLRGGPTRGLSSQAPGGSVRSRDSTHSQHRRGSRRSVDGSGALSSARTASRGGSGRHAGSFVPLPAHLTEGGDGSFAPTAGSCRDSVVVNETAPRRATDATRIPGMDDDDSEGFADPSVPPPVPPQHAPAYDDTRGGHEGGFDDDDDAQDPPAVPVNTLPGPPAAASPEAGRVEAFGTALEGGPTAHMLGGLPDPTAGLPMGGFVNPFAGGGGGGVGGGMPMMGAVGHPVGGFGFHGF